MAGWVLPQIYISKEPWRFNINTEKDQGLFVASNQHLFNFTPKVNSCFHSYIQINPLAVNIVIKSNPQITNSQHQFNSKWDSFSKTMSVCWMREKANSCHYATDPIKLLRVRYIRVRLYSSLQPSIYSTLTPIWVTGSWKRFTFCTLNSQHKTSTQLCVQLKLTDQSGSQFMSANKSMSSLFISSQIQSRRPRTHRPMNLSRHIQFYRQTSNHTIE